ncbi:exopolysaccharide biosynthesis protein [Roseivirga sp. E12]|uniref:exopolysaccharide biosynthesis protein n=1 Tax=Roseivirga sp. E12 TaxID=2819237 RepID=UPI001ABC4A23|nr:exopolysaccharide biosynthesis protein [Roseivirga sp. E12]MBO3699739.1 exopolysaccharide biosynthesis protein [Roseivirga sp. E12]
MLKNVQKWIESMLRAWKVILVGSFIIGGVYFSYQMLKKTSYRAETTFVLQTEGSSGFGGQLSSLANLAGVNIGSLTESSGVFQIDNIIELYRSYRMLKETLLSRVEDSERLITLYGREAKQLQKWQNAGVNFEIPEDKLIVRHDSVLKEVVEKILENNLVVGKPSRKLSILSVAYTSRDEGFAKAFNESLVEHVNDFYLETKTKRTKENLRVLRIQADSVKKVLDKALFDLASYQEENANLNAIRSKARLPIQKLQIDVQSAGIVYQEIVKNLEIAKVAHRNNQPLIQTIDEPTFPLADDEMKWYKAIVFGLFIGGGLMIFSLSVRSIYVSALKEIP